MVISLAFAGMGRLCAAAMGMALTLLLLVSGCSQGFSGAASAGGTSTGEPSSAADDKGGEAASIPFTHPTLKYSVSAPGRMTVAPNGDASYIGPSDFLTVALLPGSSDATALATADARGTGVPGFALTHPARRMTIGGLTGAGVEFTRDASVNPVTGKARTAHVLRAYLPAPGGAYRLEYGATVADSDWDPQGAEDVLMTFRDGR